MKEIIVLFEVKISQSTKASYLELASMMKKMLAQQEGLIRAERFESLVEEGKLLSMNVWESEEAIEKWRNQFDHRMSQAAGKNALFESYTITVCESIRKYTNTDRIQAPDDSNMYFEEK